MSLKDKEYQLEEQLAEVRRQIRQQAEVKPKRKKKFDYLVPMLDDNLLPVVSYHYKNDIVWEENEPFMATMTLDRKHKDYRYATKFWWRDETNHLWPMFPTSLSKAVFDGATISEGKISGMWQVVKKGEAYGIEWQSD